MANLSVQAPSEAGAALTYVAASAGGDEFANIDDRTVLHVVNGGGAPIDVTIAAQVSSTSVPGFGPVTKADRVVTIPAGEERIIGPFPPKAFNTNESRVQAAYSAVTSVTVAAFRVAL